MLTTSNWLTEAKSEMSFVSVRKKKKKRKKNEKKHLKKHIYFLQNAPKWVENKWQYVNLGFKKPEFRISA